MRVVVATRLYAPEPAAASLRLRALARALAAVGADVEVLTSRPPAGTRVVGAGTDGSEPGVRVRRWPVRRDASGAVRGWVPYLSFDVPLALRLLLVRRPDVVVVEPPPTTGVVVRLVARLRGVPYVYYAADLLSAAVTPGQLPAPLIGVLRAVEGWVLRGAVAVLTVSDEVADAVRGLGATAVTVVGTGVDTEVFTPDVREPTERERDSAADGPVFVYAGTMSEIQGAEVFVLALARVRTEHPHARLVMYGQGTRVADLRLGAVELPAGVEAPGVVAPEVVARAMSGAAAGLASMRPDTGYSFAFATKAFAASACGTPVVYAGPGPCAALITDHALGWAVDFDVGAVVGAMLAAAATPSSEDERQRRAAWARQHASLQRVARRGADVIAAAVGTARAGG